jgi:pathogenesis-related protein 1
LELKIASTPPNTTMSSKYNNNKSKTSSFSSSKTTNSKTNNSVSGGGGGQGTLLPPPPPTTIPSAPARTSTTKGKQVPPPPPPPSKTTSATIQSSGPSNNNNPNKQSTKNLTLISILIIIVICIGGGTLAGGLWNISGVQPLNLNSNTNPTISKSMGTSSPTAPTPPTTLSPTVIAACEPTVTTTTGNPVISVTDINIILHEHNKARRAAIPNASVMPMLTWNTDLAMVAQNFEANCPGLVHSSNTDRTNIAGYSYVGENLAAGYGTWQAAVQGWVNEQVDFTYPTTCNSGKVCGHYTQVIWAKTLTVGCAYKECPNLQYGKYYRCEYGPGGNYNGEAPYVAVTPTTTPATCTDTSSSGSSSG